MQLQLWWTRCCPMALRFVACSWQQWQQPTRLAPRTASGKAKKQLHAKYLRQLLGAWQSTPAAVVLVEERG